LLAPLLGGESCNLCLLESRVHHLRPQLIRIIIITTTTTIMQIAPAVLLAIIRSSIANCRRKSALHSINRKPLANARNPSPCC
jgi:MFS superfamily sulfate permease-like transporter